MMLKLNEFEAIRAGGNCEAWSIRTHDAQAEIWICAEDNTLGEHGADYWLVGLHPLLEWNDHAQAESATLDEALEIATHMMAARAFAFGAMEGLKP